MKIKLVVVEGNPKGLEIPIKGSRFSIGRDKSCNLRPASELVSKTHCMIQIVGETVKASDLGSTNGTFVNDVRVEAPVALKPGDILRVGPLSFNVIIEDLKPAVAVAAPANGSSSALPGSESESDPLEWLLGDGDGQVDEPSSSSTIMDMAAFTTETVNEQKEAPAPTESNVSTANKTPSKSDSNSGNVKSPVKDTREAATEILNKYLVRRRST